MLIVLSYLFKDPKTAAIPDFFLETQTFICLLDRSIWEGSWATHTLIYPFLLFQLPIYLTVASSLTTLTYIPQFVFSVAARMISLKCKSDHFTGLFKCLQPSPCHLHHHLQDKVYLHSLYPRTSIISPLFIFPLSSSITPTSHSWCCFTLRELFIFLLILSGLSWISLPNSYFLYLFFRCLLKSLSLIHRLS